jgi:hypothetical protein
MRVHFWLTATMVAAATLATAAQTKPEVTLPPSPRGLAAIQVSGSWTGTGAEREYTGGAWVTVDYGRPILRGRENIFGAGATYGQTVNAGAPLWRAGANETTRLTTQATLVIGGTSIAPGVYNVLVDLKEGAWTLVLSTQPIQAAFDPNEKVLLSGATNYNPKYDVVRAPMQMSALDAAVEQFTIGFVNVQATRGTLYMAWERTVAMVDFTVKN